MRIIFSLLTIVLLISCRDTKENDENKIYGKLEGIIKNSYGHALKDANVEIGNQLIKTDVYGHYLFDKLLVGEYSVSVTKESYLNQIKAVSLKSENTEVLDFVLETGINYLAISDSVLILNTNSGAFSINISSNSDWQIINPSNWVENTIKQGGGDAKISFKYSENQSNNDNIDTIQFISGKIIKQLIVLQSRPLKLLKASGIIGNEELALPDSFMLAFNKPVLIESVTSGSSYCLSDINTRQSADKNIVYFSYACAELGGDYSFSIKVKDFDGNVFYQTVSIPMYSTKFTISGYATDFILLNNDTEILISTYKPNDGKIYRYSLVSGGLIKTYDLSKLVSPVRMALNPYNSKVYIIGADPKTSPNMGVLDPTYFVSDIPSIFTLDLKTDQIEHAVTIKPDRSDDPYPYLIPHRIAFTSSGFGVVILIDKISSGFKWKVIDSTHKDSLYNHDKSKMFNYSEFNNVHANFDHSKLYLIKPWGQGSYGVFHSYNKDMSLLIPNYNSLSVEITPNRKIDRVYFRHIYDQFIGGQNGYQSAISYLDTRQAGKADFSYRNGEETIVYSCEAQSFLGSPNKFRVLDYSNGTTLLKCDLIDGLHNFSSTIDGKWAVAYKLQYSYMSQIYVFNTNTFYREE